MTTIVDLSDEPKFTIKAVASQTGIRPVTLRAWERRNEVLAPHRAENHYRLYSERDIAILRWLKFRVDEGSSISNAINELRAMASKNIWPEAIPLVPPVRPSSSPGATETPPVQYARRLSQALIHHNESRAGELLREAHALFDLMTVCLDVLTPAIRTVEQTWYRGEITVQARRFATAYLRTKMLSLLQVYPSRNYAPLILVGCAPMELQELDILMLALLLRSEGYRVEYLGPDIPVQDLADYASYEQPALVILTANSDYSAREMHRMQEMLGRQRSESRSRLAPAFAYTGKVFSTRPAMRREVPGVYLGDTLDAAFDVARGMLKARRQLKKGGTQ